MIGTLTGKISFSDGKEIILTTNSGVGYQLFYNHIVAEGSNISLFISHIFKDSGQELYGFRSLQEKKAFEFLISVKGVGPKSAFTMLDSLTVNQICQAIDMEDKKTITKVPGIGPKAAAQIILDLNGKTHKVKMYSPAVADLDEVQDLPEVGPTVDYNSILNDTLLACKELGFDESKTLNTAQTILKNDEVSSAEQLVHLVLKEI